MQPTIEKQTFSLQDLFESSKQTAIKIKNMYPDADIYPFYKKGEQWVCHWSWKDFPGCNDIEGYNKEAYWGLKMSSVPLVVLDFDIKSDKHPTGMTIATFNKLKAEFELNDYPHFTVGKSGQGGHYWFYDKDAPKKETGMDFIQGIDYKVNSIIFLNKFPFPLGINDLRPLPPAYLARKKTLRTQRAKQAKGGRNNTLNREAFLGAQTGNTEKILKSIWKAGKSGLSFEESLPTLMSGVNSGGGMPNLNTKANSKQAPLPVTDQSKNKIEDYEVLLYKKQKIVDTSWGIENWFEYGCLSIIAGEAGSGKTTFAIKLAVLNAQRRAFWTTKQDKKDKNKPVFVPKGDGRKSLYICFERKHDKAHNKEVACGGCGEEIDILTELKDKKGKLVPVNLENPKHLKAILKMIRKNNYWSVIIDPVVDLVLSNQNDNAQVRKQIAFLLRETHDLKTIFFGIAHLKKQRGGTTDAGALRGASEFVNMATSVCRVFELKDDEGFVLTKLKVNESKTGTKGGIKYKIETLEIHENWKAEGSKEEGKGGIRSLEYYHKSREEIKKGCVEELPDANKASPLSLIQKVIMRLRAENRELNTVTIKKLAFAEGVSTYFLDKCLNWNDVGYTTKKQGQGKDFKVILIPNL